MAALYSLLLVLCIVLRIVLFFPPSWPHGRPWLCLTTPRWWARPSCQRTSRVSSSSRRAAAAGSDPMASGGVRRRRRRQRMAFTWASESVNCKYDLGRRVGSKQAEIGSVIIHLTTCMLKYSRIRRAVSRTY